VGQRSDEIRQDIERTRDDLSTSLDVLGDRVSPRRAAQRSLSGVRGRLSSVRQTVIGAVDGGGVRGSMSTAGDRAGEAAATAADQIREAPEMLRENVEGNPLAAGIIAFGAGLLVGSIVPPTAPEKRMASSVAETLQPAIEQAQGAVQELKSGMQESVRGAAEQLKDEAKGAAQDVKEQAKGATDDVKEQAKGATEDVREQAKGATEDVKEQAKGATEDVKEQRRVEHSPHLDELRKDELYKRAQKIGIEGRSQMTKPELVTALREHS
jgi:uncharacterized protein YjbJ (UPF0337 family)